MREIQWNDSSTIALFNPRLLSSETEALDARLKALQDLKGHLWLATSGSTAQIAGELKWVALSKQAILASARGVNEHLQATDQDIWIHALPDFHVGGIGIFARAHLSGARVVDGLLADSDMSGHRKWDPAHFYRLCHETRATLSALVPAQVFDFVQRGLEAPRNLRGIVIGGAALSESLYVEARKLGWNLLPSYGLTECCSQVATASLDSLKRQAQGAPDFSFPDIRLLPHVEIAQSSDGRLRMRGPSLLTGYGILSPAGDRWIDPKTEGWFQSEDRGTVEGGVLRIQGRSSDFIKIGGESVDLNRLEKVFTSLKITHQPSFDLALIPVPDDRLGHVIQAAVAVDGQAKSANAARRFFEDFNERVLPFERVRKIHFLERIPRSPLQKLLKAELLRMIQAKSPEENSSIATEPADSRR